MKKLRLALWSAASALGLGAGFAAAVGGPPAFDVPWFTIDGGGSLSTGGPFTVAGTIGQPDAGVMTGGPFELTGGFWSATMSVDAPGDCDDDGHMGSVDYACFRDCLTGPGGGLLSNCDRFDFEADADVDLRNFASFQANFD